VATASQIELIHTAEEVLTKREQQYAQATAEPARRSLVVWASLMGCVLIGSILRIAAVFEYNPLEVLITDPGRWWEAATHLSNIQPIHAIDAPGYPLWLAAVIAIFGSSATAIAVHNSALSVMTPWIWHRLVRELTGDRDIALTAWAILACLPSWISVYSYTLSETLFLPLLGAALWCSVRAYDTGGTKLYAVSALLWALASATRVFALPLGLACLVWTIRAKGKRQEESNIWPKLAYAVLAFAVIVVPLSIRAHHILNVWDTFGFQRMNQIYKESGKKTLHFDVSRASGAWVWGYEFGSPSLYQEPLAPLSHWKSSREGVTAFSINEDNGRADWDLALKQYRASFRQKLQLWGENYIMFSFAPSWPDDNPNRFWDHAADLLRWCWVPLAIWVIPGNVQLRKWLGMRMAGLVALLTTLGWILTPLLPAVMEGRYRKPIEGLLIVNLLLLVHCSKSRRMAAPPLVKHA